MKIVVAETAGFCMGVERAVDLALKNSDGANKPLYTLGPLIHNHQTMEMLKSHNVTSISEEENPTTDRSLLVRAHGIPPKTEKEYREKGYELIDGTCPKVRTVHKVIEKYRKTDHEIVITGDDGHAEVVGLMGYADGHGHLINNLDELPTLPESMQKICVVSQTTFNSHDFDIISDAIADKYPKANVIIRKTICAATDERQTEIIALRDKMDAIIVVGGRHSANTIRLAEIAGETGVPVFHIEEAQELDIAKLAGYGTVAVTAGASTPRWLVEKVVDLIEEYHN